MALSFALALLLAPTPETLYDHQKVDWLKKHAVRVSTVDPSAMDYEDFADLAPLKSLIGDARIVMLGEATHEDGNTAKGISRLVRFLHQEMGFNVLAFEADAISCRGVSRGLADPGIPLDEAIDRGVWNLHQELIPLYEYVRESHRTKTPLRLDGFDHMIVSRWGEAQFLKQLTSFFDRLDPKLLSADHRDFLANARSYNNYRFAGGEKPAAEVALKRIGSLARLLYTHRDRLMDVHGRDRYELMRRTLEGFKLNYVYGKTRDNAHNWNIRDRGMANNVAWLASEVYPKEKIVVWAATAHTAQRIPLLHKSFQNSHTLGEGVHRRFLGNVYSIAFVGHSGSFGTLSNGKREGGRIIQPPPKGALEDLLGKAGFDYAIVDLKSRPQNHWLKQKFSARPFGHGSMTGEWHRHVDAFFFTKTLLPVTYRQPRRVGLPR